MTTEQNKSPPENDSPIATLRYMLDRYHSEGSLRKIELFAWLNHDAPALIAEQQQLLMALESCCERFRREIAADDLLRGFFGNDICSEGLLQPFLIPQHGCIPEFLRACAAIAKARGQQ